MSIRVMSAVFECESMTSTQKLVALALADHCHDDGSEARPGMARLKRKTSLSERTIQRALKELLRVGHLAILRESTPVLPAVYRFTVGGGAFLTGGATVTPGGGNPDAGGVSQLRANHQEPLLKHSEAEIVDMESVKKRNDKIFNRNRNA